MTAEALEADFRTNILLVDDRPPNLLTLEAVLEPLGQNIVSAGSGEEALKKLLDTDFAVVLLDVLMPGLDGFETAALMKQRERTRHIPIIFLTAVSQHEQHIARGYTLGAVDYISKPFHPEILRAKVAVFVELYRKNEQIRRQGELLQLNEQRERERALEELRRLSEKRYQELAESMPQIVWTAAPDGRMTYANRRWFDYAGFGENEQLGGDWRRIIHLDDRVDMERAWELARATGERAFEIAVRFRRASDGVYRWHLVRAVAVLDAHGEISEWIGTCTDIDDRKRAEDGLRFLADASKVLASSLDYRATLVEVSELAAAGVADWCAIHLRDAARSERRVALAHATRDKVVLATQIERRYGAAAGPFFAPSRESTPEQVEVVDAPTDGMLVEQSRDAEHLRMLRELRIETWIQIPLVARHEIIGAIRLGSAESGRRFGHVDISLAESLARRVSAAIDNARLYEAAQREQASLAEASRAKDEFLAVLSHELRSPLNAMLGWAEMLRSGILDAATSSQALETIERSVKSQARLIGDILDVSRITTGKLRLNIAPTNLSVVIMSALETVRAAAEAKSIEIVTRFREGVHPIPGDSERLQQVVWNLLSNAIKFTPRGGRIEIELARRDGHATIAIRDNGIGIGADFLPYVFDRFRQADSSTTRVQGGLGLGLSIVRHLIELHGGRVRAESDGPSRGTSITVEIPEGSSRTDRVDPESSSGAPAQSRELDGVDVLIVEDHADGLTLFQAMLEKSGAHVRTATSAVEALAAIDVACPDVLVSDIGLPGASGYELIRRIRTRENGHGRAVPALALTAYASEADRQHALSAGFQEHIAKPVERTQLVRAVAALVDAAATTTRHR